MSETPKSSRQDTRHGGEEARAAHRHERLQSTDIESRSAPDVLALHEQIIREMDEPSDGLTPTPVWFLMACFALIGWGGYYIASNSGGFRADMYNEKPAALYEKAGGAGEAEKSVDLMAVGKRAFNNCTQCHQATGAGIPGAFPPLDGSDRVVGPPHVLAAILIHGLHGPISVKGKPFNGDMPAWGALSDEELAGVMTYIRGSWGNKETEVSPAFVKAVRTETASQTSPWTDEGLNALAKQPPPAAASAAPAAEPAPPAGGEAEAK